MITLKKIMSRFGMPIPKRIRIEIEKWICLPEPQKYLAIALKYEIDDKDAKRLYSIGNHKGKYPRLYYLCCIYIHPLTIAQNCMRIAESIK